MVQDPNRLSHNAVGTRFRIGPEHRVKYDRSDPGQSQFAGQHQPIGAGTRDDDINHLAHVNSPGAAGDNRRTT